MVLAEIELIFFASIVMFWIFDDNSSGHTLMDVAEQCSDRAKDCSAPGAALTVRYLGVHRGLRQDTARKAEQRDISYHQIIERFGLGRP